MKENIKKLFQLLKNGIHNLFYTLESNKVDVTQFKAYLH